MLKDVDFDYAKHVGQLSAEQRLTFYEMLAHNLTISVRGAWSDDRLSDVEKIDRMKCINEIMHRITAKISVTRRNEHEWSEHDVWEMIKGWVSQNANIQEEIETAVLRSYSYVTRQSD